MSATIAVLASVSRIDDMVTWITDNTQSLAGSTIIASPSQLADRLKATQEKKGSKEKTRVSALTIQALEEPDGDVHIASKVLSGEVKGVILFKDTATNNNSTVEPDLNLLVRVCNTANVPLALNKATADLALRGVAKTRTAYLIFNPVAGQGDSKVDLELIKSILEPILILHVIFTEKDRDVSEQAKEVVNLIRQQQLSSVADEESEESSPSSSMHILIASGGDGTVSAVAGATMDSGVAFGAIPRGTANAFSVALGIPTKVDEACYNILAGHTRVIDGGMCNATPFINLAGVGFEAGLVDNATRELKNVFGNFAYALGGAQQALTQKPFACTIEVDEEPPKEVTTKVITVANVAPPSSVFAQGFGEVIPDDGLFEVTINSGSDSIGELEGLASLWINSVVKTDLSSPNLLTMRCKQIKVNCDPPQKLLLDGEVLEANPVTFKVIPGGLTVITPATPSPDNKS